MEIVNYDDFAKLEIRIGTIKNVEIVEEADRLLKLTVDTNDVDEEGNKIDRQVVSGIREFFEDPQELVGKQCPFLVNLKSRNIKGYESQGMILAVGDAGEFSLLHPTKDLPAGIKVC